MLLRDELNLAERSALHNMTYHPGFKILQRMIDDACRLATEEVIKLDPGANNYERLLVSVQNKARAINEFASALRKSVDVHCNAAIQLEEEEKEQDELVAKAALAVQRVQ